MTPDITTPTTPGAATSSRRPVRTLRWRLPVSLAFALTATGCGALPFGGDDAASQDIAAVDVEGIEPGGNTELSSSSSDANASATTDAGSTTPQDDGESRLGSDAATIDNDATQPTAESDDETEGAFETTDDRFVGRSARYLVSDIELGTIVTTNIAIEDYLNGTKAEIGDTVTAVEVNLTSVEGGSGFFSQELFGLVDADGVRFNAEQVFTPRGDREYSVTVESQATTKLVFVFPEVDLDGASFVLSEAGRVPAIIPLTDADTTQTSPYAFDVTPVVSPVDVTSNSFWENCLHTFTADLLSATATLDGRDGSSIERTALDERFLVVEIALTNITDTSLSPCGGFGPRPDILDPRLSIDGVTMAPSHIADAPFVEAGATVVGTFTFRVPTGAHDLVLTSITGDEITSWAIDLPAVVGE